MIKDKWWLEHECQAIRSAMKLDKKYKNDTVLMIKFMLFSVVLLIAGFCHGEQIRCPHCENEIEIVTLSEGRPGYWQCKRCGYWNLEGIWRCPCCGTNKGDK